MDWVKKLQLRWGAGGAFQVLVILLVFACTGLTVVYCMKPALRLIFGDVIPVWARIAYLILILPVYNLVLLMYGFLFGQFRFFWEFEKKFFNRMVSAFKRP
jgi:hypothetical protein